MVDPHLIKQYNEFTDLLTKAINKRENILNYENPLESLPLSLDDEEKIRIEQTLLKNVLSEFKRVFWGQ